MYKIIKNDTWKKVKERPLWTGGTMEYYETGNKVDYAVWHKEEKMFMGWVRKNIVEVD